MRLAVKFRVLLVAAVALGVVVSAAFAAGVGPSGSGSRESTAAKPRLSLVSGAHLVIVGRGFRSTERVTVTASISGAGAVKSLVTDGRGQFTARLRTGPACGPVYVLAVGSKGSRAVVRQPAIPAPCGIDPAPGGGPSS